MKTKIEGGSADAARSVESKAVVVLRVVVSADSDIHEGRFRGLGVNAGKDMG